MGLLDCSKFSPTNLGILLFRRENHSHQAVHTLMMSSCQQLSAKFIKLPIKLSYQWLKSLKVVKLHQLLVSSLSKVSAKDSEVSHLYNMITLTICSLTEVLALN